MNGLTGGNGSVSPRSDSPPVNALNVRKPVFSTGNPGSLASVANVFGLVSNGQFRSAAALMQQDRLPSNVNYRGMNLPGLAMAVGVENNRRSQADDFTHWLHTRTDLNKPQRRHHHVQRYEHVPKELHHPVFVARPSAQTVRHAPLHEPLYSPSNHPRRAGPAFSAPMQIIPPNSVRPENVISQVNNGHKNSQIKRSQNVAQSRSIGVQASEQDNPFRVTDRPRQMYIKPPPRLKKGARPTPVVDKALLEAVFGEVARGRILYAEYLYQRYDFPPDAVLSGNPFHEFLDGCIGRGTHCYPSPEASHFIERVNLDLKALQPPARVVQHGRVRQFFSNMFRVI